MILINKKKVLFIIIIILIAFAIILCRSILYNHTKLSSLQISKEKIEKIELVIDFDKQKYLGWEYNIKTISDKDDMKKYIDGCNAIQLKRTNEDIFFETASDKIRIVYNDGTCRELIFKNDLLCSVYTSYNATGVHIIEPGEFYRVDTNTFEKIINL